MALIVNFYYCRMSLINRYLKCFISLTRVHICISVFDTYVTDCMEMAIICTARWPYVGYHVLTADIFRKPQQVALLFCIGWPTPNILTDCGLFVVLLSPLMQILCYSRITSTKSPSFCMITFSASLTNVALLLPQSRGRSCYLTRPITASPTALTAEEHWSTHTRLRPSSRLVRLA